MGFFLSARKDNIISMTSQNFFYFFIEKTMSSKKSKMGTLSYKSALFR